MHKRKYYKKQIIISNYDDKKNPYYAGGGATAIHEIASRLIKEFTVTVLTGKYPNCRDEKIDGVFYMRIGFSFAGPKLGQIIYQLLLPYFAIAKNYDLWLESFTPPFSTAFLPLFTKKPVIGLAHMLSEGHMNEKYKFPFHLIERVGIKFYKDFIVLSKVAAKHILKINRGANVRIIANGVKVNRNIKNKKRNFILYMGRIEHHQKGLDLLLRAYKYVSRNSETKLKIVGSGTKHEERSLARLIAELKLEGKIQVLGRVEGSKKNQLFEVALCTVIPSRFETFSLVALEALSLGSPIVCFDIDGLRWLPSRCVLKVKAFDEKLLGKAIIKLIKDSNLGSKMSLEGIKLAKNYSWEKSYEHYLSFIKEKITPGRRGIYI